MNGPFKLKIDVISDVIIVKSPAKALWKKFASCESHYTADYVLRIWPTIGLIEHIVIFSVSCLNPRLLQLSTIKGKKERIMLSFFRELTPSVALLNSKLHISKISARKNKKILNSFNFELVSKT